MAAARATGRASEALLEAMRGSEALLVESGRLPLWWSWLGRGKSAVLLLLW